MKDSIDKQCLRAGQVTVGIQDEGVSFSIKPLLFGQSITKIIPYNTIVRVSVGPKWWIFPGFRILVKSDTTFYLESGGHSGSSFKHNFLTFYPWDFKKWEKFAISIRQKITIK